MEGVTLLQQPTDPLGMGIFEMFAEYIGEMESTRTYQTTLQHGNRFASFLCGIAVFSRIDDVGFRLDEMDLFTLDAHHLITKRTCCVDEHLTLSLSVPDLM